MFLGLIILNKHQLETFVNFGILEQLNSSNVVSILHIS